MVDNFSKKSLEDIQKNEHSDTREAKRVVSVDSTGQENNAQYPSSADGDSVYCKDIDIDNSDIGDFSGDVCDLFDSLKSLIQHTTSDNPKSIKVLFHRTVYAHQIGLGCDNLSVGFGTDITVKLLGSGETVRYSKNFININPNSALLDFDPKAFNGIILEFNTEDTVCISNVTIRKAIETNTFIKSPHYRPLSLRMNKIIQENLTLADDTIVDSRTINMTTGHGLAADDYIILLTENGEPQLFFAKIISVDVNELTLDTLVPCIFEASETSVTQYDPELNKDGSTTVYKAELKNPYTFPIDITRFIMHITDATDMDDGKFGGRTALTNGISLRKKFPSGCNQHFWNVKTNGNIGELAFDKEYDQKAPSGVYGFSARLTYAGQDKHGVVIRLEQGEAVELLIQDDLTGLTSFSVTCEGHFTE